jgi:hypothetical protein
LTLDQTKKGWKFFQPFVLIFRPDTYRDNQGNQAIKLILLIKVKPTGFGEVFLNPMKDKF